MAWLVEKKRKDPKTGRQRAYWAIGWRTPTGRVRTRGLGYCSKQDARRALRIFEGRQAAGQSVEPTPTERGSPRATVPRTARLGSYLEDRWLPSYCRDKAASTCASAKAATANLVRILGRLPVAKVDFATVDAYITERKQEGRRSRTIIIELRLLRCALAHAKACGLLETLPELPTMRDTDRKPHRFLTDAQALALLEALRPLDVQPHQVTRGRPPIQRDRLSHLAVLLALNLGLRKGELLSRRWEDVAWTRGPVGCVTVADQPLCDFRVKTRRSRVVPLTREAREALEEEWRQVGEPPAGWIFPCRVDPDRPRSDFRRALQGACDRAEVPRIHPHGLRHTWASRLAMAGVDRRTLMDLGGWTDGRVLDEIYSHTTDAHRAAVMEGVGLG